MGPGVTTLKLFQALWCLILYVCCLVLSVFGCLVPCAQNGVLLACYVLTASACSSPPHQKKAVFVSSLLLLRTTPPPFRESLHFCSCSPHRHAHPPSSPLISVLMDLVENNVHCHAAVQPATHSLAGCCADHSRRPGKGGSAEMQELRVQPVVRRR